MNFGAIALIIISICLLIAVIAYFLLKPKDAGFVETVGIFMNKLFPPPAAIVSFKPTAQSIQPVPSPTPAGIQSITPTIATGPAVQPVVQSVQITPVPVYTQMPVQPIPEPIQSIQPAYTPIPVQSIPIVKPVAIPVPSPAPLLAVPLWAQQKELEGLLTLPDKSITAFAIGITATPSTTDVYVSGSGFIINPQFSTGKINLKCTVKSGIVTFALQDETARVTTYTGTLQTGNEQSLTNSTAGQIKVWPRGYKNTLKMPLKMNGFLVQDCTRYPFDCMVIGVGNDIYMQGNDSFGAFVMTGNASGSSSQDIILSKLYRNPDSITIAYKGVRVGDVIKGQWSLTNGGQFLQNEFVIFPSAASYTDSVELYGTGAACKYASDWKGGITINNGEKADGTLNNFSITEAGVLYCDGQDAYGLYQFKGRVTNKDVQIDKYYTGVADPIKMKGTLTTNTLQGTWTLGDMTGTFMYIPK